MDDRQLAAQIILGAPAAFGHARRAAEWGLIQKSFPYFLFRYCRTRDEHDPTVYAKRVPLKAYLREIAMALQLEKRLAIPKSRQMLVSWTVCAFVLWVTLTRDHALCFVQSKKEEDADALLGRLYDLYVRLDGWLRKENPVNPSKDGQRMYCHMIFPWTRERVEAHARARGEKPEYQIVGTERARVWAIPQGPDVLRQYTATLILSDEDAFQERAGDAFKAAAPTVSPDAWWIKVSSANPGHFQAVVLDRSLDDAA